MQHGTLAAHTISRIRVAILPSGAPRFELAPGPDDAAGDGLAPTARTRLARAIERGAGHAILDLGATALGAPLAPDLAFVRDIGRAFVTHLCAGPDLEEQRERIAVDCPPDEAARLAGAGPPMGGAAHGDGGWVRRRRLGAGALGGAEPRVRRRDPRTSRAGRRVAPRAASVVAHGGQGVPAPRREPRRRRPSVRLPPHLRRAGGRRRQDPASTAGAGAGGILRAQGPARAAAPAGAVTAGRRAGAVAGRADRFRRGLR